MVRLSVNVNKIALLRNTRKNEIPDVVKLSLIAIEAGAHGITVHPRPDERHIRPDDVLRLHELLKEYPEVEFNIEGNPLIPPFMDIVRKVRPHQCTLVPDSPDTFTSNQGWEFTPETRRELTPIIEELKQLGSRVSLFLDPIPENVSGAKEVGADRIELYTEAYADAYGTPDEEKVFQEFKGTADAATAVGLGINAGHDLNLDNLNKMVKELKGLEEVSIGHALVADALELGMKGAVEAYLKLV